MCYDPTLWLPKQITNHTQRSPVITPGSLEWNITLNNMMTLPFPKFLHHSPLSLFSWWIFHFHHGDVVSRLHVIQNYSNIVLMPPFIFAIPSEILSFHFFICLLDIRGREKAKHRWRIVPTVWHMARRAQYEQELNFLWGSKYGASLLLMLASRFWKAGPSSRKHLSLTKQYWRNFESLHHFSFSSAPSCNYFWLRGHCCCQFWPRQPCRRLFPCIFAECKHNLAKQRMCFQKGWEEQRKGELLKVCLLRALY